MVMNVKKTSRARAEQHSEGRESVRTCYERESVRTRGRFSGHRTRARVTPMVVRRAVRSEAACWAPDNLDTMQFNTNTIEYVGRAAPKLVPRVPGWEYDTVAIEGWGVVKMHGILRRASPTRLSVFRSADGGMRWSPSTEEEVSLALSLLGHASEQMCSISISSPSFLHRIGNTFRVYESTDGSDTLSLLSNSGMHFRASMRLPPPPLPTSFPIHPCSNRIKIPKPVTPGPFPCSVERLLSLTALTMLDPNNNTLFVPSPTYPSPDSTVSTADLSDCTSSCWTN
jgi:hypothetical protein